MPPSRSCLGGFLVKAIIRPKTLLPPALAVNLGHFPGIMASLAGFPDMLLELSSGVLVKCLHQAPGNRAGLASADPAPVDLRHRSHFRPGSGQETLIGDI